MGGTPWDGEAGAAKPRPGPVVVLAAHPDDETIGAGALLARLRAPVLVHLTDGVPRDARFWPAGAPVAPERYARLRRAELARALAAAGVAATSHRLGAVDQEAALALAPLARALAALLEPLRPPLLVTHAYEGGHPDHDAAAFVARAAAALLARGGAAPPRLVEMTSYHAAGEGVEAGRFLPAPGGRERALRLGPAARARKAAMLEAFASQREVLAALGAAPPPAEERFRPAPACDFRAPPHPGPLWYERIGFRMTGERWRALAARAAAELELGPGTAEVAQASTASRS